MVASEIRNQAVTEEIRFDADYQGSGIWKIKWIDNVVGTEVGSAQPYPYTYYVRVEYIGPTTDGKARTPAERCLGAPTSGFWSLFPKTS